MKHIVIAGASRSGKTTLSLKFRNLGFNHYKMDSIKRGLDNNFYEGRIELWNEASPKFAKLISRIIREADTDIINGVEWYIIDTCHLYPKDIAPLYDKEKTVVVFLGYPNIKPEDKLKVIRENDPKNGWTWSKSDEVLLTNSKMDIDYSIEAQKECESLGIKFFDTENFDKAINDAYNYILENINE